MRVLSETEFVYAAEPLLRNLFAGNDPYQASFAAHVEAKLILFEYWYELEDPLLPVFVEVSLATGAHGLYVSVLDRPEQAHQHQPYHWYVRFDHIEQYRSLVGPLENVVYADNGQWAIMGSDEHHGLLACSASVYAYLIRAIPDIPQQVYRFLQYWAHNKKELQSDVSWVQPLLVGTYGAQQAEELLRTVNMGLTR